MTSISNVSSSQGRYVSDYSGPVDKFNEQHADEIHRMATELIRHFSGCALGEEELKKQIREEVGKRMPDLNSEEMSPLKRDVVKSIFCSI
jgi:predicted secreted Zn-dependent protease